MSLIPPLKSLSLTTSLLLAGTNLSTSLLTIPLLLPLSPQSSTPFFKALYYRGAFTLVPLGIFSSACSFAVAYLLHSSSTSSESRVWVFAGLATISQMPWTLLTMASTNSRLIAIAEAPREEQEKRVMVEEVGGLLRKWGWLNGVRGCLALVGGVVGVYAVVS